MDQAPWDGNVERRFVVRRFRNTVAASLRDGVHRMSVVMTHDGYQILAIRGKVFQHPWSTCPEAINQLSSFIGLGLDDAGKLKNIDQQTQCTHLMDLARLAARHVHRAGTRRYRLSVCGTASSGHDGLEAIASLNEQQVLNWIIVGGTVITPPTFEGLRFEGRANLPDGCRADPDLFEITMMLIRCVKMLAARARAAALPPHDSPIEGSSIPGACYSLQPENISRAYRTVKQPRLGVKPSAR